VPEPSAGSQQATLAAATETIRRLRSRLQEATQRARDPVAVVGAALRMPGGARTPAEFWSLLRRGVDTTREFPASRADARSLFHPDPDHPRTAYVIRGAFVDDVDGFDPGVFGISPREAVGMDPQQRIALELAWEALEAAGYAPTELAGRRIGVYIGVSTTDYVRMRQQLGDLADVDAYQLVGEPSFIAGRISYTFGLRGPSMVIDTTCSSALVAVHQACQALGAGECDVALAGGVNLMLSPYGFLLMSKFRALAADGRCKTFDASADGYARGEGAGLVVLKRLPDALAGFDSVLAVIRGSAVNHDGRSSGLTVPSPEAQQDVIRRALAQAGLSPRDITYVEAHGTGTSLGDPIELRALDAVLGEGRGQSEPLLVGSVKTNVGHLEPAAGIAGLLKVILALQHGEIPPHLNLATPNPKIPWRRLRIRVPTSVIRWPDDRPRLAAVSSFGASGTNAHVVVAAPDSSLPAPAGVGSVRGDGPPGLADGAQLLLLSARTDTALHELAGRYASYLAAGEHRAADVCFTSQVGRARHARGLAVLGHSGAELAGQLAEFARGRAAPRLTEVTMAPHSGRRMGWLLTGQGAQYPGMAKDLRDEPGFAEPFGECGRLLDAILPRPVEDVLWGDPADRAIDDTGYTQPALFAVEYALGRALMSWGLRPSALLGHSVGEISAACLAGALALSDAVCLVAGRARLMAALPPGGVMAAVNCDEATAREVGAGQGGVAVAAVNGTADVVLSGADGEVRVIADALTAAGYRVRFLNVSHAFHSPLLEPMLAEFGDLLGTIKVRMPEIPLISNVTGRPWGSAELEPGYWIRQARGTVRFHDGIRHMHADGIRTFVEVGPQPVLTGLARKSVDDPGCVWLTTLSRDADDRADLLRTLGALHLRGCRVGWERVHSSRRLHRVPGPGYPWEHERFWFRTSPTVPVGAGEVTEGLGVRVRGPEPVFEEHFSDEQLITAAGGALGWLVERSVRAAVAGLGGRWRRLSDVRAEPVLLDEARGPWLTQTAVRTVSTETAQVATAGAHPDSVRTGEPWHSHGRVTLARSAESGASVRPAEPSGDGAADEATAWRQVVEAAIGAVAAQADRPGWAPSFAGAYCPDPSQVNEVRVAGIEADDVGLAADVTLHSADGGRIGELRELRWDPVPAPPRSRWHPTDELVYMMTWIPAPASPRVLSASGERILLIGADEHVGGLAGELCRRGAACTVIQLDAQARPPDLSHCLTDGLTRIIVSGLGIPVAAGLSAGTLTSQVLPVEQLVVRLTRQLTARSWTTAPPRLVLLTTGAMAAGTAQRAHNPGGATLWGLGRVIALEHPECWGGAIDLDPDRGCDPVMAADAVLDSAGEDQMALRGDRWLVARLRAVPAGQLPAPTARRPLQPGTVLVTGGWGGIGTAVAEWLVRNGAERLVLAGRTALPDETTWDDPDLAADMRVRVETMRRLRDMGAQVEATQLDVTDEASVGALVSRLAADPCPLRGVIHAAGVSAPQDLAEVDDETYRQVWAPKTIGAWLLHQATRDLELDFFVGFSSIAATWGSQHLASYAAANMFLDALAHHRRSLGLPSLTVDWGPWGVTSGLYAEDVMSFLESVGLRQLHPAQCLSLLQRLMRADDPQYVVCAVDWARYKPVMEARTDRPVLAGIRVEADDGTYAGDMDRNLLDRLSAHSGDDAGTRMARLYILAGFLRSAVARVLRTDAEAIATDADVFALGLDSLMVMEVVTECRRRLGAQLRPSDFFARTTLAEWTGYLDEVLRGDGVADAGSAGRPEEADAADGEPAHDPYTKVAAIASRSRLADEVHPAGTPDGLDPDRVLLTGATGFVGAFLLDELLASTSAEVVCLVRCTNSDHGLARIRHAVEKYLPWRSDCADRVCVVAGDLAQPRFGRADPEFTALAERVDAVYHAAAWVDFVHTFDQLAAANIAGTQEILRLASRGRPKLVHHVSTYGIWGLPVAGRSRILETDDIGTAGRLVTGYVQTKWGSEHLVAQARERGLPARTFRLGRVLGDSRSGVCLTTHFTCRVIKGCVQLGIAPDLDDLEIEMTPVDYVARALVHISGVDSVDGVFHLINPNRMRFLDLVRFMRRNGWPIEVVDRHEWWAALRASVDTGRNELHPVMDTVREFVVGGEEAIDYDVTRAEKALAGSGISCPPLDERLLETYFGYFIRSGYLIRADASAPTWVGKEWRTAR
jgi:thioester reductase-like protein